MNAVGQTLILLTAAFAGFVWWLAEKRPPKLLTKGKMGAIIVDPVRFLAAGAFGWAFANSFLGAWVQEWLLVPVADFLGGFLGIGGVVILNVIAGLLVLVVICTLLDLKIDKLTLRALVFVPLLLVSAGGVLAAIGTRGSDTFGEIGMRVTSYFFGGA